MDTESYFRSRASEISILYHNRETRRWVWLAAVPLNIMQVSSAHDS